MDFKPLNVQFEIDDEKTVDELLELATRVAKQRGDRRLRAANVSKEIVLRVLHEHPELIAEFFPGEVHSPSEEPPAESETHPKVRRKRQP